MLSQKHQFSYPDSFPLECGASLPGITITYHTYGKLNADRSNVVWICHALTANSDPVDWWPGVVGPGGVFDDKWFVVCANIIGSCYGTTGPLSESGKGKKYYSSFPLISIRDMVNAHELLRKHLGISTIAMLAGGSMGGYQALEWAFMFPAVPKRLLLLATGAAESAWGIAIHSAQRLALQSDNTFGDDDDQAGSKGLKVARAIGMLTYRNYDGFVKTQTDPEEKLDNFRASSYIEYQGEKLVKRFNAYSYFTLSKAMDTHNIGRGRGGIETALHQIKIPSLVIGISSDILCPVKEQQLLADHLPNAQLVVIESPFGHDGFLVEAEQISKITRKFLG